MWWHSVLCVSALHSKHRVVTAADLLSITRYPHMLFHSAGDGMNVQAHHIESGAAKMAAELGAMGIDMKKLLENKVFMYNEFGMGGGISECGDTPGTDARIGFFPWLGITVPYSPESDPFKRYPATKEFLIKYYRAALNVLSAGGYEFPVHHSYIWNCVSWDVQGIHTASALWNTDVDQGDWPVKNGFAVQEVIDMIKTHNAGVNSRGAGNNQRRRPNNGRNSTRGRHPRQP